MKPELTPFERWAFNSNLRTIAETGVSAADHIALLRENGYGRIADGVNAALEKASPLYDENSPEVLALAKDKQRVSVLGKTSVYRLSNGWIARRRAPDSGWRDFAYWSLYRTPDEQLAFAGGEKRLARAIANGLNAERRGATVEA